MHNLVIWYNRYQTPSAQVKRYHQAQSEGVQYTATDALVSSDASSILSSSYYPSSTILVTIFHTL